MIIKYKKILGITLAVAMTLNIFAAPALAISYKEEQQLGDEVLEQVFHYYRPVTDQYVVSYINQLGSKLLAGVPGQQPFKYEFFVIDEPTFNAFAIPAGRVFVNSGLFIAMDKEAELAGVMSHEIAHVTSRHISGRLERATRNQIIAIGGMLASVLLGMTGGSSAGDLATATMIGTVGGVTAAELSYSREDELQADQVGVQILKKSGYKASGMMEILTKIRGKQYYGPKDFPTYLSSHPALDDRMAYISSWMLTPDGRSVVERNNDERAFNYAKTRLIALYGDIKAELPKQQMALAKNPNDVNARYRYALLLNRNGQRNEAIDELSKVLQTGIYNGYAMNDLGRIYFEAGNYAKAQELLEKASVLVPQDPENRVLLGRIYGDNGQLDRAETALMRVTKDFPNYADAYYFLAQTMGKRGKSGWAHYYTGVYYMQKRDNTAARRQFDLAYKNAGGDTELQTKAQNYYDDIWRKQNKAKDDEEVDEPIGGNTRR